VTQPILSSLFRAARSRSALYPSQLGSEHDGFLQDAAGTETYADFRMGDWDLGIVELPKSEIQMSADLRDEADRIDDFAHALADHFGRTVVVVWTNPQA
jgi:hypothetical protein